MLDRIMMENEGESSCRKGIYFHFHVGVQKTNIKDDFIATRIFFFLLATIIVRN